MRIAQGFTKKEKQEKKKKKNGSKSGHGTLSRDEPMADACSVDSMRVITVGPVAQRITRLTTDQKIPGSNPGRIVRVILCSSLSTTSLQHFRRRGLPGPSPPCSPAVTTPCRSFRLIPWALPKDNAVRESSIHVSIGGSVVECSPATRAARVRFPADAYILLLLIFNRRFLCVLALSIKGTRSECTKS